MKLQVVARFQVCFDFYHHFWYNSTISSVVWLFHINDSSLGSRTGCVSTEVSVNCLGKLQALLNSHSLCCWKNMVPRGWYLIHLWGRRCHWGSQILTLSKNLFTILSILSVKMYNPEPWLESKLPYYPEKDNTSKNLTLGVPPLGFCYRKEKWQSLMPGTRFSSLYWTSCSERWDSLYDWTIKVWSLFGTTDFLNLSVYQYFLFHQIRSE
jgi:hypothetical protein